MTSDSEASDSNDKLSFDDLSETQQKMLRILVSRGGNVQVAGYGRAKWLSAARALMRRGLADSYHTGKYYATDAGKALLKR